MKSHRLVVREIVSIFRTMAKETLIISVYNHRLVVRETDLMCNPCLVVRETVAVVNLVPAHHTHAIDLFEIQAKITITSQYYLNNIITII